MIGVKLLLGQDIRRVAKTEQDLQTIAQLQALVYQLYPTLRDQKPSIVLHYRDNENDWILLQQDLELVEALRQAYLLDDTLTILVSLETPAPKPEPSPEELHNRASLLIGEDLSVSFDCFHRRSFWVSVIRGLMATVAIVLLVRTFTIYELRQAFALSLVGIPLTLLVTELVVNSIYVEISCSAKRKRKSLTKSLRQKKLVTQLRAAATQPQPSTTSVSKEQPHLLDMLIQMEEMGFSNRQSNLQLLIDCNFDFNKALYKLVSQPE